MGFYRVWWVFTEFFFLEIVFFICLSGSLRPCTAFHCVFTEFRSVVLGFCRRSSFFFFFSFFFSFLRTSFGLGQANGAENSVDHLVVVVRPPPSCTSTRFTGFFCFFFTEFRTTMVFFVEVSFPFVNADVALNKSQQRPAKTIKARPTEFGLPSFIGLCINIYIFFFWSTVFSRLMVVPIICRRPSPVARVFLFLSILFPKRKHPPSSRPVGHRRTTWVGGASNSTAANLINARCHLKKNSMAATRKTFGAHFFNTNFLWTSFTTS